MAVNSRQGRLVRTRGGFGCWKTYDRTGGAVRDARGADAALIAVIDGGGVMHPVTTDPYHFPDDSDGGSSRGSRRRRNRRAGR